MIIRAAIDTDIAALFRLEQYVQDIHNEAHPDMFRATLDTGAAAKRFADIMTKNNNLVLVAEEAGEVIGYVWCQESQPFEGFHTKAEHTGYIAEISVAPEQRHKGLGKALVERAVAILKERGVTRIGVEFWSFNAQARSFFSSLGFVVQRELALRRLP